MSLDSKSADKELKAETPEKSKACATAFKEVRNFIMLQNSQVWMVVTWSAGFESKLKP